MIQKIEGRWVRYDDHLADKAAATAKLESENAVLRVERGAEAEALRVAFELLMHENDDIGPGDIQDILDRIDAGEALAYLEKMRALESENAELHTKEASMEEQIAQIAHALGNENEWSSEHDLGEECIEGAQSIYAENVALKSNLEYMEAARAQWEKNYVQLEQRVVKLRNQLPDGMENCTIRFIKCDVGHGRLTADNWIDHGCPTCEINALKAEIKELKKKLEPHPLTQALLDSMEKAAEENRKNIPGIRRPNK